eukprot:SAG31_NODE_591_length_13740_cov_11.032256_10_plen_22_part_01
MYALGGPAMAAAGSCSVLAPAP